eukprot:Plantae.Rhodophyta-Purpureofilum_apyrenoidigerum.ctg40382.p1 GENE.Plantae.Rhodophyta-Purpureofilum_apyrenoidigerum.ctg40382~~Plantae.Rhodophyta-Purpureofilum_apyrenoidigerum.ctg40382.p1  ORF type:complete len:206 (+),score=38.01 Plantae.Rhodophyta-Purpureofilum_apyrenoidigerum.ctg40382:73-690(+)
MQGFQTVDLTSEESPTTGGSVEAKGSKGAAGEGILAMGISNMTAAASWDNVQEKLLDVVRNPRPWGEFMNTKAMAMPTMAELRDRVQDNLRFYKNNYIIVAILFCALSVLTNPLSLIGIGLIFVGYMYLFVYSSSPLKVAGFEIDTNQKKTVALILFGCLVSWLTNAGATLTTWLSVMGIFALVHAALRKSANEADFETAYTPQV